MAPNTRIRCLPRVLKRRLYVDTHIRGRGISSATTSAGQQHVDDFIPHPPQPATSSRREGLRDAKPFSSFLTDTFNRQHNYLRISLTERCNLRCVYCMPADGIQLSPNRDLLTSAEIYYLSALFVSQGVTKIRLTGGEPTVRKDILPLMRRIGDLRSSGLKELALTTNAIKLHRNLDAMVEAGLTGVNISLDTLDPFQFQIMTRRQGFDAVMRSIDRILEMNKHGAGVRLKINCVVMRGLNEEQILNFVEKTRNEDIEVRFIEYMPFDGNKWSQNKMVSYTEMLDKIRVKYPTIARLRGHKNDTSKTWAIPGFRGRVGFITSMTHNFCGTCNRLRITSDGNLKVCLHGNTEVSLRDLLRSENNGAPMDEAAFESVRQLEMKRAEGQDHGIHDQGSWGDKETQLLEMIGAAVKRKKAKHAGIGELEHMPNRPMILIGNSIKQKSHTSWKSRTRQTALVSSQPAGLPTYALHDNLRMGHARLYSSSPLERDEDQRGNDSVPHEDKQESATFDDSSYLASSDSIDHDGVIATLMANSSASNSASNGISLTHVTASGEAHMVDVANKQHTRRVAIATGRVLFDNVAAYDAIIHNNNRKGDVLGTARIAGIMAAKRTSEIIPLCHPISITRVVVDVFPTPIRSGTPPQVAVNALVECVGPTGVEMEAMVAASSATLTVYDMCKAVDRKMTLECDLSLKSGGRSGFWARQSWWNRSGKQWAADHGVEVPESMPDKPTASGGGPGRHPGT